MKSKSPLECYKIITCCNAKWWNYFSDFINFIFLFCSIIVGVPRANEKIFLDDLTKKFELSQRFKIKKRSRAWVSLLSLLSNEHMNETGKFLSCKVRLFYCKCEHRFFPSHSILDFGRGDGAGLNHILFFFQNCFILALKTELHKALLHRAFQLF